MHHSPPSQHRSTLAVLFGLFFVLAASAAMLIVYGNPSSSSALYIVQAYYLGYGKPLEPQFPLGQDLGLNPDSTVMRYIEPPPKYSGTWRVFYNTGQVALEAAYTRGQLNGERKLYAWDGNPLKEQFYVDGKRHGVQRYYSQDGTITEALTLLHGKLHGVQETYYGNGQIASTGQWFQGARHGWHMEFNKQGTLKEQRLYFGGSPVAHSLPRVSGNSLLKLEKQAESEDADGEAEQ